MIAIFIKEVREKLKWAALVLLVVSSLLAWALRADRASGLSLLGTTMAIVSVIAFPAAGFTLGLLAILSDARRGRWQFVMHRPIDRRRIFAAKALAGMTLYLLATLPTLLIADAWAATPGHVPGPVTPDMILPRLADLLGGLMWFATGMLVASRTARWVGSRLLPAVFAFFVTIYASMLTMYFTEFVLISAAATAALLAAACSAFIEGGEIPRPRWIARTIVGISLATGWIIAIAVGIALAAELVDTFFYASQSYRQRYYQVLNDGRIAIFSQDGSTATDLQGKPIPIPSEGIGQNWLSSASLNLRGLRPEEMPFGARQQNWGFHTASAHVRQAGVVNSHGESWFYVVSRNSIDGYKYPSSRIVGSMWPHGWSSAPQAFPERLLRVGPSQYYFAGTNDAIVASTRTVWHLDFLHRGLKRTFIADAGDEILDATSFYDSQKHSDADLPPFAHNNVVATRQGIYVFKDGQLPVRIAQQYQSPAYYMLVIGRATDGRLVLDYYPQPTVPHPALRMIIFASADGKISQQVSLPDLPISYPPEPFWEAALPALATPPGVFVLLGQFEQQPAGAHALAIAWTVVLCTAVLAALAAIPLARRRQYSAIATAAWAILNLLLGIPGVLMLLSMDDAVPTVACADCGRQRPITREQCPHCAAGFAAPATTGIEIFVAA